METEAKLIPVNTHIHDRSLSWLDTATSIKHAGLNYDLYTQTSLISARKHIIQEEEYSFMTIIKAWCYI